MNSLIESVAIQLRIWRRSLRLKTCRHLRGHHIVPDAVVFAWKDCDRLVDGVVIAGEEVEIRTVICQECGR